MLTASAHRGQQEVIPLKTILLLFGGANSEHEVSRSSLCSIYAALDKTKYTILLVGITKDGRWLRTEAAPEDIQSGAWETHPGNCKAILSPSREDHGLLCLKGHTWEAVWVDCVLPVLHGRYGEDGTIQGLCEVAGLPYMGPGVYSSAACMDKSKAKAVIARTAVRQADYYLLEKHTYRQNAPLALAAIHDHFGGRYPLFVKPCVAGSSVGVTKVRQVSELAAAMEEAWKHDRRLLVEEALVGREVEVAVLGNLAPKASVVGEVLSANEFYDYAAKYINAASRTVIPAELSPLAQERLRAAAVTAYTAMDCEGLARVDFFLTEGDIPIFNEINTLPGFTSISMYPKLWEASGLPYGKLLDTLIDLALEAHADF